MEKYTKRTLPKSLLVLVFAFLFLPCALLAGCAAGGENSSAAPAEPDAPAAEYLAEQDAVSLAANALKAQGEALDLDIYEVSQTEIWEHEGAEWRVVIFTAREDASPPPGIDHYHEYVVMMDAYTGQNITWERCA